VVTSVAMLLVRSPSTGIFDEEGLTLKKGVGAERRRTNKRTLDC
jgi:hypothetical protein